MAVMIRLGESFTGEGVDRLPVIHKVDPIEADGSLLLADMNHPLYRNELTFIPGETVPNLLNNPALLDVPIFTGNLTNLPHSKITLEKTAKNGIHFIAKPGVLDASLPVGFSLTFAYEKLRDYLKTATGHDLYYSWWGRVTRGMVYTGSFGRAHFTAGPRPGAYLMGVASRKSDLFLLLDAALYSNREVVTNNLSQPGPLHSHQKGTVLDMTGFTQTAPPASIFAGGSQGENTGYNNADKNIDQTYPSLIFYRFYMEDLTVSGRSYAEVKALDEGLYAKECLTQGGRYYGDSWTNPASLD